MKIQEINKCIALHNPEQVMQALHEAIPLLASKFKNSCIPEEKSKTAINFTILSDLLEAVRKDNILNQNKT